MKDPLAQTRAMNTPNCFKCLAKLLVIWLPACASTVRAEVTAGCNGDTDEQQKPAICVRVTNMAGVDDNTLSIALNRARLIFRDAGVRAAWLRCPARSIQTANLAECSTINVSTLILRITSQPATGSVSRNALGFAVTTQGGSVYATVFRDRVLALAQSGRYPEAVLLGHAIAHELGHLLLNSPTHARYGLMAARWRDTELDRATVGLLQFSPAEASSIRAEALRRSNQGSVASATNHIAQRELR
jgi:hypothetical protein